MKFQTVFLALAPIAVFFVSCSSGPVVRDTSHDDPRKVAEIKRLIKGGSATVHRAESKFIPRPTTGWTTYKIVDREHDMTSALEIQTISAAGGRKWLEVRNISPTSTVVTRMVTAPIAKPTAKTADGKFINQKLEQLITWTEGDKEAKAFPSDMIGLANQWAAQLAPHLETTAGAPIPKKAAKVPAGTFPVCFVHNVGSIPFLREAEETCYSSLVPTPFIVRRDSDSQTQELVRYGFGSRSSFIPSRVKIVVDKDFSPSRTAEKPEPKQKAAVSSEPGNNPLSKILNL